MPKYRATFVRIERFVAHMEFDSYDETNALHYALCRLGDGVEFDEETSFVNELVEDVKEISDE